MKLTGYIFKYLVLEDRAVEYSVGEIVENIQLLIHYDSFRWDEHPRHHYLKQSLSNQTFFTGVVTEVYVGETKNGYIQEIMLDCAGIPLLLKQASSQRSLASWASRKESYVTGWGDLEFEIETSYNCHVKLQRVAGKITDLTRIVELPFDKNTPGEIEHVPKIKRFNENYIIYMTMEIK